MRRLGLVLAGALLAGCALPNKAIRSGYADFNQTIHYNQSQQMLLNLVRLKYRELPLFLKVGALSASYAFDASGSANFGKSGKTKVYGIGIGSSFSTRPTITYTPLEGETYVKQVLSEVDPGAFVVLVRSGWPIRTLCHVMVERIEGHINHRDEPSYADFEAIVETLAEAQDANRLEFIRTDDELLLQVVSDRVSLYGEERGAEPIEHHVPFSAFQFRSFLDIMFFLGKNTRVPRAHEDQVRPSRPNGWMDIRTGPSRPSDALVSVRHNGHYFSIARTDIRSKDTFALVRLLYQMQAGDVQTAEPILTLPVAQP